MVPVAADDTSCGVPFTSRIAGEANPFFKSPSDGYGRSRSFSQTVLPVAFSRQTAYCRSYPSNWRKTQSL